MAAINFPDTPILNQQFTVNDRTWYWDGAAWVALAVAVTGPAGPSGPSGEAAFSSFLTMGA